MCAGKSIHTKKGLLGNLVFSATQQDTVGQTQKLKLWQNSKTQYLTKLKNSNCNKTWKLKQWKNQKKSNCDNKNSNCDKNQKLELQQN